MNHFPTDWEDFKDSKLCNAWVATAIVGASVVGAGATIFGANRAADAQKSAANTAAGVNQNAINNAQNNYGLTRSDLAPYNVWGQGAESQIINNPAFSTIDKFAAPTAAEAAATPGYDFTLTQGLKSTQNSVAARGLGNSGAALKGAAAFATGLANNTYGDTYNRSLNTFNANQASKSNAFNRLSSLVGTGENAAAMTGAVGSQAANTVTAASNNQAGNIIGGGNAAAAASNAAGTAISGGANNIGGYLAYQGLYGNNPSNAYGGGSPFTGDAYGGNSSNPLPGLTADDYGAGY